MTKTKESFEYQAEMKQLLQLIVHSLYTHPEVFLRELISNASDALNKVRFRELTDSSILDAGQEFTIKISVDEKKKTFSIEDNGIGMTKDELIENIGTVAKSGSLEFFKKLKDEKKTIDENLIGQFGVGFYSVFMVTDEVILETRSAEPKTGGYRWVSDGQGKFTIEEIEKKNRGTKISFILKEDFKDYAKDVQIKEIIKKYSNFANFPIFVGEDQVNQVQALWQKKTSDIQENEANEFYKFLSNDFENPMGHFHIALEGTVNFKALIFIPMRAPFHFQQFRDEKSLSLYANKILIQEDCKELVPEYLRFVKGVVDTEDLPLNVSREVTQSSPVMVRIKKNITNKVLAFLENWAENEKEKYEAFYKVFAPLLKTGVEYDFENKDKIIDLLRYESSREKAGTFLSFKEYVGRMKPEQKEIYYLSGENRETIERNPNLEYFKKHDIEVLFLTDPVDAFIIQYINEYDKKSVKSIDKADLDFIKENESKIETPEKELEESLLTAFKETLKDKVEDVVVSKRLVSSPVTLVAGKQGMDSHMEKMMRMMNTNFQGSKKILEVNMEHPLVSNLSRLNLGNSNDPMLRSAILQLFEGALLQEGTLEKPGEFIQRMYEIMEKATK